ncbi:MAG: crossover junction endodeoxyribonuclease RuvC [Gammaproteobacteria bacterium]|nr:crossover junction endodeoxyribonuclease RuvC [Gammaproteobacteria bacterium]
MRILGIDPGSRQTGFGLIDAEGNRMRHVHSGFLRIQGEDFPARLRAIFLGIRELVQDYAPEAVAIEQVFVSRNADSALKLGQARGAAICGALQAEVPVAEYSPREVKQALVGRGGAAKEQVQHMVGLLLNLPAPLQADQADALAIAICHHHVSATLGRIPGAAGARGGRLR